LVIGGAETGKHRNGRHFESKFYRAPVVLPSDYSTNKRSVTKQLNYELG